MKHMELIYIWCVHAPRIETVDVAIRFAAFGAFGY